VTTPAAMTSVRSNFIVGDGLGEATDHLDRDIPAPAFAGQIEIAGETFISVSNTRGLRL